VLRLQNRQMTFVDELVPPFLRRLPEALAIVDRYLDDDRFFSTVQADFDETIGRPTVPVEVYLRMMYLKHSNGWGFEAMCQAVSDSFQLRFFCHLSIDGKVPHYSTLVKLTQKYGPDTVRNLCDQLVVKMAEDKLVKGDSLRFDSTVMDANIEYPTDSGLLQDGIRYMSRTVKDLKKLVEDVAEYYRDGTRTAKDIQWAIGAKLKSRAKDTREVVLELTGKMASLAERVVAQGKGVLKQAVATVRSIRGRKSKKVARVTARLEDALNITQRVLDQTRRRLAGEKSIADRIVSIFDRDARAIPRGKLSRPNEFGFKVNLEESERGVITGFKVFMGNPADVTMSVDVVERHRDLFGHYPKEVATDKGYTSKENEEALKALGVKKISMPVRGKRSKRREAIETSRWFRELQRWRAGCEATISRTKRKYGLNRTYLRGYRGARIWVGFAVFAQNLGRVVRFKLEEASAAAAQ
jgi:IS5 family transposase